MAKATPKRQTLNSITIKAMAARAKKEKLRPYLTRDPRWGPGLCIRVFPSGSLFWYYLYRRHGAAIWYSLGQWGEEPPLVDLDSAKTKYAIAAAEVAQDRDPQADRIAKRGEGTFSELYAGTDGTGGYLKSAKAKNKSWKQADRLVRGNLLPVWKRLQPTEIARADVRRLLRRFDDKPAMHNAVLSAASAIFTWAASEDLLATNPCIGIKNKETTSRERILSDIEIPKFWKAFDAAGMAGLALRTVMLCGQRPGEVSRMRTEHISEDGWWEMPGAAVPELRWKGTKNKRIHRVFLPAPARDIIADIGADGFVFGGVRGGPVVALDRTMREICKALDVPPATPHDLRRTHGTLIASLNFGTEMMNRIQNHAMGGIGAVYNRYDHAAEKQHIMEAVAAKIMRLVDGTPSKNVVAFSKPL
jgi:integrase